MTVGDAAPGVTEVPAELAASVPAKSEDVPRLGNRRGQTLLAGFTTAHFSHHVSNSLLNPLLPFIRDSFALSYAESGFLVSAFSLSLGVSNAPIGVIADRIGSRPVVAAGLVLTGVISVAVGLAAGYWTLLVLLILMGLIAGSYHAPAAALLARAFPANVRGTAMGLHITGGHLSFFAVPVAAAAMLSAGESWRAPYLWLAFAPVISGVMVWYLAPREHESTPGGVDRWAVFRELGSVIRLVGPLVSVSIVFQMIYAALLAFTTLYLVDARGLEPIWAAAVFGVPQLVGVLGGPASGFLSDRLGRRTVILTGMGLLGPSLYLLTVVPPELLLLPLILIGVAATMRQTVTEVFVLDSAPPHRRATVLGSYYMLSQELGGLAAPLLGFLALTLGITAAYTGTCIALAAMSVAVVLAGRRL